jgi:hypothetical protein
MEADLTASGKDEQVGNDPVSTGTDFQGRRAGVVGLMNSIVGDEL